MRDPWVKMFVLRQIFVFSNSMNYFYCYYFFQKNFYILALQLPILIIKKFIKIKNLFLVLVLSFNYALYTCFYKYERKFWDAFLLLYQDSFLVGKWKFNIVCMEPILCILLNTEYFQLLFSTILKNYWS